MSLTVSLLESGRPAVDVSSSARVLSIPSAGDLFADGLDDLHVQLIEYVCEVPASSATYAFEDVEQFLAWLAERGNLTDEQQEELPSLYARDAVEFVALRKRLAHVRFQELLRASDARLDELHPHSGRTLHLNPVHAWTAVETAALRNDPDAVPATVLVYAVGRDTRTIVVTPRTEPILRTLERQGPTPVRRLVRGGWGGHRPDVSTTLRDLVELGLVAVA
jgi:hypothetical protein